MRLDALKPITIKKIKPTYLTIIISEVLPAYYIYLSTSLTNNNIDKYSILKDACVLQELQIIFGKRILKEDLPKKMQIKLKYNIAVVFSESLDFFNLTNQHDLSKAVARKINDQIAPKI